MKYSFWAPVLLLVLTQSAMPAFAMKSRHLDFPQPCDSVWKAAVAVAKSQDYRVVSISKEEQIISVVAGGSWGGERIISLNLAPGAERGCVATVQSRFSGLAHSDGPDLLVRVSIEVIGQTIDRGSKPFRRYKDCLEGYSRSMSKCQARLRKDLAVSPTSNTEASSPELPHEWWQMEKPKPTTEAKQ